MKMEKSSLDKKENTLKRARYNLAKASDRIFARLIDIILMVILSVGVGCAIFLTDPAVKTSISNYPSESWRYFLFCLISIIIFFSYFIILPFFWKGQTVGKKTFKLAFYNVIFTHYFLNLIKHDLFIWETFSIISFIFGIICLIIGDNNIQTFMQAVLRYDTTSSYYIYAIIFTSLYTIFGLVLVYIVISTCINNSKQSIIDKFSNVVVIKLVDVNGSDKTNERLNAPKKIKHRNYSLPGVVIDSPHDTIDSLDDAKD